MTKVTKALLVAFGSAGLVGTGFAAWNITISGGTSANRTVTPNTDGDVVLVARGLLVSDVATSLTFHADTGTQVATYNVKAEDSDWYDNVDLLDASEEKVSLKVSFAGDSDTHEWSNYIALTEAVERTYSPSEWLEGKSSSGLDVSFTFNWVGLGVYANPKAYAQATYPTVESQQAYLEAVSAAIEGLQFTFSFDLVANEPVTPPSPSVESVSASLSSASIEVGQTSTLTVNTNLANNVSGYSIVEDSGIPAIASFENGVFTGVSAGEVRFKVEIDSVKSSEVVLTVTAASPVDEVLGIVIDQAGTDPTELEVGDDMTLTTTISKTGDPAISLSWVSSDEDVIMVDDGYVLAAEAGTATVTVTETNSGKSASIDFIVSEPAPVINYGTAQSPLSVEDALTEIGKLGLGSNAYSTERFYVAGKLKANPTAVHTNYLRFYLLSNDGNSELQCYSVIPYSETLYQNDVVVVEGLAQNYNGNTLEIAGTTDANRPTVTSLTRGTSAITISLDEHATATITSGSYTNGSEQTFTVGVDDSENYEIKGVTGATATGNPNEYSFTVGGPATISVTTQAKGQSANTTTASTTIESYATTNSWTNSTQYSTINLDSNVTITAVKTNGSSNNNTGKYYTSGQDWRCYQNETPEITVAVASGYELVSVTITYNVGNTGVLMHGDDQIASETEVSASGSSILFGVGNTGSATNGQVRITEISVTYQPNA